MIKLLVLNLLDSKPMSVYDIKSVLEELDAVSWANILIGSIQNAINSLFKLGAIEIESVKNVGKRKKTIYKITEYGYVIREEETKKALESEKINFPYDFYVGLSSLDIFQNTEKINILKNRREKLVLVKESINSGITIKEKYTNIGKIQYLVVENMMNTLDAQIELIDKIINYLKVKNEN